VYTFSLFFSPSVDRAGSGVTDLLQPIALKAIVAVEFITNSYLIHCRKYGLAKAHIGVVFTRMWHTT
jgi:hypothetical protein